MVMVAMAVFVAETSPSEFSAFGSSPYSGKAKDESLIQIIDEEIESAEGFEGIQDGKIEAEVKLTGILSLGALQPGEVRKYGTTIAPGLYAHVHHHFLLLVWIWLLTVSPVKLTIRIPIHSRCCLVLLNLLLYCLLYIHWMLRFKVLPKSEFCYEEVDEYDKLAGNGVADAVFCRKHF